eukprot:COSAG04_NODE_2391_length_4216_cov_4.177071_6_plen_83_part_00
MCDRHDRAGGRAGRAGGAHRLAAGAAAAFILLRRRCSGSPLCVLVRGWARPPGVSPTPRSRPSRRGLARSFGLSPGSTGASF